MIFFPIFFHRSESSGLLKYAQDLAEADRKKNAEYTKLHGPIVEMLPGKPGGPREVRRGTKWFYKCRIDGMELEKRND